MCDFGGGYWDFVGKSGHSHSVCRPVKTLSVRLVLFVILNSSKWEVAGTVEGRGSEKIVILRKTMIGKRCIVGIESAIM